MNEQSQAAAFNAGYFSNQATAERSLWIPAAREQRTKLVAVTRKPDSLLSISRVSTRAERAAYLVMWAAGVVSVVMALL